MIQEIKLSDKISIYKTNYNWEYSQKSFVERAKQVENFKLRNNIILYFLLYSKFANFIIPILGGK